MYYTVKVAFEYEDEKTGKLKSQNVSYLVDSQSVTEAEARTTKYLLDEKGEKNFKVLSVVESKITEVISS
jgi:major membrane immunogen (membrane-anchored lipoprotein)